MLFVIEGDICSLVISRSIRKDWTFVKIDAGIMLTPLQGNDLCLISSLCPSLPDSQQEADDQEDGCQNKDQDGESK